MAFTNDSAKPLGIITFHRALNAGAVLQCYALQRFLDNCGVNNVVVDYRDRFIEKQHTPYRLFPGERLKCAARAVLMGSILSRRVRGFDAFVEKYLRRSKPYHSAEALTADRAGFVGFVTGSDQVFSPDCARFDPVYFLDFEPESRRRASYAASIGRSELPAELLTEYRRRLAGFPHLSLREEQAAELVHDVLSLPDMETVIHADPTLMLPVEEWTDMAVPPPVSGDYILLYMMMPSPELIRYAQALGRQSGLPVYWLNDKYFERISGIKTIHAVAPDAMLGWFSQARHVVTNSFHGAVFSILFDRSFAAELPEGKSVRLTALLGLLGLEAHALRPEQMLSPNIADLHKPADKAEVLRRLEMEQQRSRAYVRRLTEQMSE